MQWLDALIQGVLLGGLPSLIVGPRGSGKHLAARYLHHTRHGTGGRLQRMICGSLTADEIDDRLRKLKLASAAGGCWASRGHSSSIGRNPLRSTGSGGRLGPRPQDATVGDNAKCAFKASTRLRTAGRSARLRGTNALIQNSGTG